MLEIIDIAPLYSVGPLARRETAVAIRKACRETGFFYAANHNVGADVIDAAYVEAARLQRANLAPQLTNFGRQSFPLCECLSVSRLFSGTHEPIQFPLANASRC